jgi:hypothetical protein
MRPPSCSRPRWFLSVLIASIRWRNQFGNGLASFLVLRVADQPGWVAAAHPSEARLMRQVGVRCSPSPTASTQRDRPAVGFGKAWNATWNDGRVMSCVFWAFWLLCRGFSAGRAYGADGRSSCKRQVSGSIPLTGSQVRGHLILFLAAQRGMRQTAASLIARAPAWSRRATAERGLPRGRVPGYRPAHPRHQ